jgi:hypothetical protein
MIFPFSFICEGLRSGVLEVQFPDFPEMPGIFPKWQIARARD